jgi:VWFA-related protein
LIDQSVVDMPADRHAFDMQQDGTTSLAVDTGGFAIRNENNFGRALDTIQRDTATYYVLAYSPTNNALDGKYRSISVKVNRPDIRVRARRATLRCPGQAADPAARNGDKHSPSSEL